ncbi:triose-phosphate isomerase [Psychroflexus sp. CAK57W]|uniref:triose-phosphate isomerase n=1 Tax=Psychroflexus curvus TaxID=2873595 RepID=UPI001CCB9F64|nr:triose-phosphate isomerase [Psychroflexus curvus]MBZ9628634.1 triose-phosphate isomerase [Psychroflexus curvus]MBZ9787920.1 triose-phosphate isomerase [Psychroflexus curvus]
MRTQIVAGNWKMNCNLDESLHLLNELKLKDFSKAEVEVVIAPTFTNLYAVHQNLNDSSIKISSQNINENEEGAYTGEISPDMLKSVGVEYVIIGHSERRAIYNESDELLAKKATAALKHDLKIMFCIGEMLDQRKADKHFDVVKDQLEKGLFHLSASEMENVVIAYEPVWAIGTGETASPEQAQEIHEHIRNVLAKKYNQNIADQTSILYGGSVKPNNAKEIFAKKDVDGGLIGGASLDANSFAEIVMSF